MVPFIFSMHEIPVAVLLWSGRVQESLRLSFRQWGCWLCVRGLEEGIYVGHPALQKGKLRQQGVMEPGCGYGPLSPPLHELFFFVQQQGVHWLNLPSPHAMCVVDEVFHVPFPVLCQEQG